MKMICRPTTRFRRLFREQWVKFYGMHCAYCTSDCTDDHTIDHLTPRSRGGGNTFSNLVLACRKCNEIKGNRTVAEFRPLLLKPIKNEVFYVKI